MAASMTGWHEVHADSLSYGCAVQHSCTTARAVRQAVSMHLATDMLAMAVQSAAAVEQLHVRVRGHSTGSTVGSLGTSMKNEEQNAIWVLIVAKVVNPHAGICSLQMLLAGTVSRQHPARQCCGCGGRLHPAGEQSHAASQQHAVPE